MSFKPPSSGLFGWSNEGLGMSVEGRDAGMIAHEDLFGEDTVVLKDERMFIGTPLPHRRFIMAWCMLGVCLSLLIGKAFWMQIVQGNAYQLRILSLRGILAAVALPYSQLLSSP